MTEARRKAKIALLEQRKKFTQLAYDAGLSAATVHNVLDDRGGSEKSKQAITNALGVQLWPEFTPNERHYVFPIECELEFPEEADAREFAEEFAGFAQQHGRTIAFLKPTPVVFSFPEIDDEPFDSGAAARNARTPTTRKTASKVAAATRPQERVEEP